MIEQKPRTGTLLDGRARFRPNGLAYTMQINVEINAAFLWAVAKCIWHRKSLRITHHCTNEPLLEPDVGIGD